MARSHDGVFAGGRARDLLNRKYIVRPVNGYRPDPGLLEAIAGAPQHLRVPLLTTALIESGGRLDAVGDGGRSHGPYQEFDLGRGSGIPVADRRNPFASTERAVTEFTQFYQKGHRGARLASASQRPANPRGYEQKYRQALPTARAILNQSGIGPGRAGATGQPQRFGQDLGTEQFTGQESIGPRVLTPQSATLLRRFLTDTREQALAGQTPTDVRSILGVLEFEGGVLDAAPRSTQGAPPGPRLSAGRGNRGGRGQPSPVVPGGRVDEGSYGYADPEGQGGRHLAIDIFGQGKPFQAPEAGRVVRVSQSRGNSGQIYGGTVSVRTDGGLLWVFRHVEPGVKVGDRVQGGQKLGQITNWQDNPSSSHVHTELYRRGAPDRTYDPRLALNPAKRLRRLGVL